MTQGRRQDHLNRVLLGALIAIAGTGLFLFTQFHIGRGHDAVEFAGIPKAYWRDLHRIAAVFFFAVMVHHLHIHWRTIKRLLTHLWRLRGQAVLFLLFSMVSVTGLVAWTLLPHTAEALAPVRHFCIDVHNITGLMLVTGLILHLRRRWRFLLSSHTG